MGVSVGVGEGVVVGAGVSVGVAVGRYVEGATYGIKISSREKSFHPVELSGRSSLRYRYMPVSTIPCDATSVGVRLL